MFGEVLLLLGAWDGLCYLGSSHIVPMSFHTKVISYHFGHFVPTFIFILFISYPAWSTRFQIGHFIPSLILKKKQNILVNSYPVFTFSYSSYFVPRVISYPYK